MPWVISFIVSWIVFFFLVDFSKIKVNVIGGTLALSLATFVDWGGQELGLYRFHDLIIPWFGCSAFYKFGPILTMGTIFTQYVPNRKWFQLINVIVSSLLFLFLELITINTHVAEYVHWHFIASLLVDLLTFSSLTWITVTYLRSDNKLSV
ncbi:MAG: hypothetical protein ACOYWZ_11270 [Bacillota bacterium]